MLVYIVSRGRRGHYIGISSGMDIVVSPKYELYSHVLIQTLTKIRFRSSEKVAIQRSNPIVAACPPFWLNLIP